jgi:hypothetical protein
MSIQWLDTETRERLQADLPKFTEVAEDAFSVILLRAGADSRRVESVVLELIRLTAPHSPAMPLVVCQGLSLEDAMTAQAAFACCDSVAVFVRDELAEQMTSEDFVELQSEIEFSGEFQPLRVRIEYLPRNEQVHRFYWIFLGLAVGLELPVEIMAYRKKARLMQHWAHYLGGQVTLLP